MGAAAAVFGQDFVWDEAGQRLAAAVTAWAQIDILVLNVSIELPDDLQAISREHFDRQIAVNLRTTLELLQALVPPHGRTLLESRRDHRQRAAGTAPPCDVRLCGHQGPAAQVGLEPCPQFGGQGVTLTSPAPGAIRTARNRDQMAVEGETLLQRIPAGRLGRPDDNLFVDGGRTAV